MTITKSGRQLVVIANLATTSRRYKELYTFLDSSTLPVARVVCGRAYAKVSEPENGSLEALVRTVRAATMTPETEAVDLVIACHGVNTAIKFTEGKKPLTAIEVAFAGLPNRHKLRFAYDLCCFGASHAPGLHRIGFDAVVGSRGVNANSAFELPTLLGAWASGQPLGAAVAAGNNPTNRAFSDAFASLMFNDVDSFKELSGADAATLRISSTPQIA
jgi:hypothetical protein